MKRKLPVTVKVKRKVEKVKGDARLFYKKHSSAIKLTAGLTGLVVSVVSTAVQTTKLNPVVENHKTRVKKIHDKKQQCARTDGSVHPTLYPPADQVKDIVTAYGQTAFDLSRLYFVPAISFFLGTGFTLASHFDIARNLTAVTLAYGYEKKKNDTLRKAIETNYGQDAYLALSKGLKPGDIIETEVHQTPDGEVVKVKKVEDCVPDIYWARDDVSALFDETCPDWYDDAIANMNHLMMKQGWVNERLAAKGHLFLNDVWKDLGVYRNLSKRQRSIGQVLGWKAEYDDEGNCTTFIDFNLTKITNMAKAQFVAGVNPSVLIEPQGLDVIIDFVPDIYKTESQKALDEALDYAMAEEAK